MELPKEVMTRMKAAWSALFSIRAEEVLHNLRRRSLLPSLDKVYPLEEE
jgi:hypothetical protein